MNVNDKNFEYSWTTVFRRPACADIVFARALNFVQFLLMRVWIGRFGVSFGMSALTRRQVFDMGHYQTATWM